MNTLFSFALCASIFASALGTPANTCTAVSLATTIAPKATGTISGTATADADVTMKVTFTSMTAGGADIAVADASGVSALTTAAFSAIAVPTTPDLVANTMYKMLIAFPTGELCPEICGVDDTSDPSTIVDCPTADECTASGLAKVDGSVGIIKAVLAGTLDAPAAGTDVTFSFEAEDGGEAVPDVVVASQDLDMIITAKEVTATTVIPVSRTVKAKVSFKNAAATAVMCDDSVCFQTDADGAVSVVDCPSDSDSAAAMSASVFVLVAAFVARAF